MFNKLVPLIALSITLPISADCRSAEKPPWPLSMQSAQAIAREHNHDLKLAMLNVVSSQANVDIAQAPPNPVMSLSTSGIRSGNSGAGSLWNKRVDSIVHVDQLIERGGKRELRTVSARQHLRAARFDRSDIERQISLRVANAYIDLRAAQDKHAASLDTAQLLEAIFQATRLRKSAGDVAGMDVERVRVDLLRARNEVDTALAELVRSRNALGLVLAIQDLAETLHASDPWPPVETVDSIRSLSAAEIIAQRPDVRASAARLEASQSELHLANSLRVRDVSIGMQYEHYPQPSDVSNANVNSIGFSIQFPLFVRHYYKGEILSADAARSAAEENLKRSQALAQYEVASAQAAIVQAADRVRRYRDELLKAAEKSAQAAEFAYQNGATGVMDVLDARRTLRAIRLDALAAQSEFSKAIAVWSAATSISSEPVE